MIFRNVLQGLGYSIQAILSGIGELIGRSIGGWLAVSFFGYTAICYSNPLAWALALFYCVWMVTRILKRFRQSNKKSLSASPFQKSERGFYSSHRFGRYLISDTV